MFGKLFAYNPNHFQKSSQKQERSFRKQEGEEGKTRIEISHVLNVFRSHHDSSNKKPMYISCVDSKLWISLTKPINVNIGNNIN
jgi:hypothetical protein